MTDFVGVGQDALDRASSEVDFQAFFTSVQTLTRDEQKVELYEPVRRACWLILRSQASVEVVAGWRDAIERVVALRQRSLDDSKEKATGARLNVLLDLLNDSLVFHLQHPIDEIVRRPHVLTILSLLEKSGGHLSRKQLAVESKLKDANLSRLIGLIEAGGFVRRERNAEGVFVELLPSGERALKAAMPESNKQSVAPPPAEVLVAPLAPLPAPGRPRKNHLVMNRTVVGATRAPTIEHTAAL